MLKLDKNTINKAFDNYVSSFEPLSDGHKLKIKHIKCVAKNCEFIAADVMPEYTDLAWLIGMLHDIGRFEQLKTYHTFKDSQSVDHADLGVKILFEDHLVDNFISQKDHSELCNIIKCAIFNHNKIEIEKNLDDVSQKMCQIIRDADKLDIFRVCATEDPKVVYGASKEEIENLVISDDIYNAFFKKETIPYIMRKNPADDVVNHFAFVFDLNFDITLKKVKSDGYYKKMFDWNFNDAKSSKYLAEIKKFMFP